MVTMIAAMARTRLTVGKAALLGASSAAIAGVFLTAGCVTVTMTVET